MKKGIVVLYITALLCSIGIIFWYNDLKYNLPTPVPPGYIRVQKGVHISLGSALPAGNKPVFLHFFNPDCPCSRFNLGQFKKLFGAYREQVDFLLVVMNGENKYTAASIREKTGLDIPVSFDTTLARSCGVYSTPQVALLNEHQELFYRGNYNKTRYCADEQSNYARMALEALVSKKINPVTSSLALTAYGCSLPKCTP